MKVRTRLFNRDETFSDAGEELSQRVESAVADIIYDAVSNNYSLRDVEMVACGAVRLVCTRKLSRMLSPIPRSAPHTIANR